MSITIDDKILVTIFNVAVENEASDGYRISQFMPEGCNLYDARAAAKR